MSRVPPQVPPPSLLYTDASLTCWDAHLLDLTTAGVWSHGEKELLERKVVLLALNAFLDRITGATMPQSWCS